jgi:hypothetical protein
MGEAVPRTRGVVAEPDVGAVVAHQHYAHLLCRPAGRCPGHACARQPTNLDIVHRSRIPNRRQQSRRRSGRRDRSSVRSQPANPSPNPYRRKARVRVLPREKVCSELLIPRCERKWPAGHASCLPGNVEVKDALAAAFFPASYACASARCLGSAFAFCRNPAGFASHASHLPSSAMRL